MREDGRMTIADFLLARIAEDEAAARRGYAETPAEHLETVSDCDCTEDHAGGSYFLAADPARVLAECEAKRRIVEGLRPFGELDDINAPELLAILASVYANHPDYDESWRP